ncbi:PAS domain-containing protein [Sphingomonas sp. ABOLE]|uniref:PAS domain-containing protein n=1 Tax=Sphingomonas sp. ABOLE TaxID=1985878 RepID=UPI000F7E8728|nr:helix-turn-helix transcriptional regulator [Sphingomonas sp. ABOLE]RSV35838.1 PAS domain-containing protein [Sphingomonas sp. ABOLE]
MDKHALLASIRLSPIASIVTDPRRPDNPIVAANTAFERLTGYGEAELLGRNCRILAGPGTEPVHSNALAHAIATATPHVVELTNYRKNGSSFRNAVMVAPVLDDNGDVLFFLGTQMEVGALAGGLARAQAASRIARLTHQQRAVLHLMARGLRSRQIGAELGLAEKTVKMHRSALIRRLGVATSGEAMRLAIEADL